MNKSHSASLVRVECFFCKKEADLCNAAAASHQALQSHPQQSVPSKTANSIIQTLSDTESVTEKKQQRKAAQDTDAEKPRGPTNSMRKPRSTPSPDLATSEHLLVKW